MPLIEASPGSPFEFAQGSAVVCVPLFGAHEYFVRCLDGLLTHTPADVAILIADDATPETESRSYAAKVCNGHRIIWSRADRNEGFVANVNRALGVVAPADAVIVNSDVVVSEGWFDRLRSAAYCSADVATATPLTNHGTIVSVPIRNTPVPRLPEGVDLDSAAARIAARSQRLRPRLPTAIGHCMYLRRDALDQVGLMDLAFSPGYGEEVDFSQRCLHAGRKHVLADDVFVMHAGSASFGERSDRAALQREHEALIAARYPDYHDAVSRAASDQEGELARALAIGSAALLDQPNPAERGGRAKNLVRKFRGKRQ